MKLFRLKCIVAITTCVLFLCAFTLEAQIITTIAGNGTSGFGGDGGAANIASLSFPTGIALDAVGNIYIADWGNNRIRKVNKNGIINTFAGNGYKDSLGNGVYSGDGGAATSASLFSPTGVAVDSLGNIYIADRDNNVIRKVNTNGVISTVAGNGYKDSFGNGAYSGDGGAATSASLYNPTGVAVDSAGNIYIADQSNQRIRKVDTQGIISTVVGNGDYGFNGDNNTASGATLANPSSVAVDASGNLFIADQSNNRIRKVNNNGVISTAAGNGTKGYSGDSGIATNASLAYPYGIALDYWGNIYISEHGNNVIRKVNSYGVISTVVGNGTKGYMGDGGIATIATLNGTEGVSVDAAGNIYIADAGNNRIRKVTNVNTVPVTLSSFKVTANNKTIKTTWHTSTEINTANFIIQHCTDGSSFTDIGTVKAIGLGENNYQFTDKNPANGINYYRIKSIDKDGVNSYTKVASVIYKAELASFSIYPTIVYNGIVNIKSVDAPLAGKVEVRIVDLKGKILQTGTISFNNGTNNTSFKLKSIAPGSYFLQIENNSIKKVFKIIVQ